MSANPFNARNDAPVATREPTGAPNDGATETRGARATAIASAVSRFRRSEDGSLIIFSLFLLLIMLMVAGMGVDLMRAETSRARLQSTLDRAVLAGASLDQALNSEAVVRDYFNKAGLGTYLTSVTVTQTGTSKKVNATAEMAVNSYFMNLLGINTLSSPAAGQAEESLSDIEISLVLDVSGSMSLTSSATGNTKITDLINAAQEFVYLMQCDPDAVKPFTGTCVVDPNTVSITVVPYAEQVLVGETLFDKFDVTYEHTASSCADFSSSDFSTIALPLAAHNAKSIKRTAELDPWSYYYGGTASRKALDQNRTCNPDPTRTIVPYSNDYTTLQTKIGNLTPGGNTSIDVAMKWGAALLDPSFQPALASLTTGASPMIDPAFSTRPFAYGRPNTQKVVVLMTDGVNTTQFKVKSAYRSGPSPFYRDSSGHLSVYYPGSGGWYYWVDHGSWNTSAESGSTQLTYEQFWQDYNLSFYNIFSWLPYPVDPVNNGAKNTNLAAICGAAKAKGVEIFTLGFETTSASNAIMSSCASSASHHFNVDGSSISSAFASIAREIHELRLTQ